MPAPSASRAGSGSAGEQRGVEQARGDRVDADAQRGEVAGGGQRHADDAALRRAVGGLPDLAVVGGDRRGVHADAALAVLLGLVAGHSRRAEAQRVERADEVDRDDGLERLELRGPRARDRPLRPADAAQWTEIRSPRSGPARRRRRPPPRACRPSVTSAVRTGFRRPAPRRGRLRALVAVGDRDERAGGGAALSPWLRPGRRAAHDEGSGCADLHGAGPLPGVGCSAQRRARAGRRGRPRLAQAHLGATQQAVAGVAGAPLGQPRPRRAARDRPRRCAASSRAASAGRARRRRRPAAAGRREG